MVLESILNAFTGIATDGAGYWVLAMLVAAVLFIILKTWQVRHAAVISLILPVLLLEFVLRFLFGLIGTTLDFGTYALNVPFIDPIEVTTGSMLLRFLDFTFNFGLFRAIGLPIFINFMESVPTLPGPSIFLNIFVAIYVSADSLIEYIFFFYVFSALLVLASGILGLDGKKIKGCAAVLAALPVLTYSYFVSNPISEYGKAVPEIQKLFYFLGNADNISLLLFSVTLIISFVLVMEILAAAVALFYGAGSATFRPDWATKQWGTDVQGVGFLYTLSFAIMYAMHQYSWYVFFPAMVIYSLFKKMAGGAIGIAKAHDERREMQELIIASGQGRAPVDNGVRKNTGRTGSNILIIILVIAVIAMAAMFVMNVRPF